MSKDLLFGNNKRNWSRTTTVVVPPPAPLSPSKVAAQTAKLKAIKDAADKGDKKAQKKWAKINKKVAKLHLSAAKGNLRSAKKLALLNATGLFTTTIGPQGLKTAMQGSFVGRDTLIGSFVGEGCVTKIKGDDTLTEIDTSGAFVGNDKLTEIITSGANPTEILGHDEILGESLAAKIALAPIRATAAVADAARNVAEKVVAHAPGVDVSLSPGHSFIGDDDLTEIITSGNDKLTEIVTSGKFIGEEERALAAEGGSCERAALKRRSSR